MSASTSQASRAPINYTTSAIDDFPPVAAPSYRQQGSSLFLGDQIDSSEYKSFTFSDNFQAKYGQPTLYYSDFHRLMKTSFSTSNFPKVRQSFIWIAEKLTFLNFCNEVDQLALKNSPMVPRRKEMEAGWTQFLIGRYESVSDMDTLKLIRDREMIKGEEGAREYLKSLLNKAIERRFHPSGKVEKYWAEKAAKYPGLDIEKLKSGHDEPEGEMVLDEGDDDVEMGEGEEQLAGDMAGLDLEDDEDDLPDMTPEEALRHFKEL